LLESGVTEASRIRLVKDVREANIASGEMRPGFGIGKGGSTRPFADKSSAVLEMWQRQPT